MKNTQRIITPGEKSMIFYVEMTYTRTHTKLHTKRTPPSEKRLEQRASDDGDKVKI